MKNLSQLILLFGVLSVFISFTSCSKDATSSNALQSGISSNSTSSKLVSGDTITLTLQPGADDGQDSYVNYEPGIRIYQQSNYNYDPELVIAAWTNSGALLYERAFVRFDGISSIPAGAKIISAQLTLYGLDPNTSAGAPQGNSLYPGTPYSNYKNNGCYISGVIATWTEDSIRWNNKPAFYASQADGVIPASTSQWNYDVTADVTPLVAVMIKKSANYGFCIHLQNENYYRSMLFSSSEAADASKHPKIVVKYTM